MSINVGEVIAVRGTSITLRIYEESNLETIFYEGDKYKGVSIQEYIAIKRGFYLIVCIVEGEYLDDSRYEIDNTQKKYIRKVEVKPIGYFEQNKFIEGIKLMPMIKDKVYLLDEHQVISIFSPDVNGKFVIGKMLKEGLSISLPWHKLFNSHIGIFGNTGSGKSNTLTKLYSKLFENYENNLLNKSHFLLIDFNGEYVGNQLIKESRNKQSYNLSTGVKAGDKFPLDSEHIWNTEILALLFQATSHTQTPFLNRVIERRKRDQKKFEDLKSYVIGTFYLCLISSNHNKDFLVYFQTIANLLEHQPFIDRVSQFEWNNTYKIFFCKTKIPGKYDYLDNKDNFFANIKKYLDGLNTTKIDDLNELKIRINCQLLRELLCGYVQFDHIQPLLKRVESSLVDLHKVFKSHKDINELKLLNVVSLRHCNQSMKKIVPLLLAKMFYQEHRDTVKTPPQKTLHFIIDEAHNILSQQSNREQESWKDYRLELFEEIIKEGRKFGMYLTLSSQRPADISPTIMSQLHNFFIHRLVNDKDLFLIDNTISTLDRMSKGLIPSLSKGVCIVTGTAFDLPLVMQVDYIENKEHRPASDDVDLFELWEISLDNNDN